MRNYQKRISQSKIIHKLQHKSVQKKYVVYTNYIIPDVIVSVDAVIGFILTLIYHIIAVLGKRL